MKEIRQKDPKDDYDFGKLIGEGTFGKVYLCTHKGTKKLAVMKVQLKKTKYGDKTLAIKDEIVLQWFHASPYICSCSDAYETDKELFMVLETMKNGLEKTCYSDQGPTLAPYTAGAVKWVTY